MLYKLYTTSKSSKVQKLADIFAAEISKSKGRPTVTVEVIHKQVRSNVALEVDIDGDAKPTWEWFKNNFPKGDADGVIWHFTPRYRRKWKIEESINGSRNSDNKIYPEFWVCADLDAKAEGYENLSEFLRIMFHEQSHYDEDLDDQFGNVLTQDSVHDFDYRLKKIHLYHRLVDFRGMEFKMKVNKLVNEVLKLAKKII